MRYPRTRFLALPATLAFLWLPAFLLVALPSSALPLAAQERPAVAPAQEGAVRTYTLPPEKYEKAVAYSRAKYRLYFLGIGVELALLGAFLAWRVGPAFRDRAERASRRRFVQAAIYMPLLTLSMAVFELPLAAYGQSLALRYEQSIQGWGSWLWDWAKGQGIGLVLLTLLVWILYAVIRRSPRRWWFYFWLASIPILLFVIFIDPLVLQPLFFKFEPLRKTHPDLVSEIGRVVERGGLEIPPERMFLMNASEKLKSVNAYVAGFGASKRVVIWDTTIDKMSVPQLLFVFGHEMGHYVLYHLQKILLFLAGFLLAANYLGYRVMGAALRRWGARWQIRGAEDWASLPLLLFAITLFSFLASPGINAFIRSVEHEADIYGLEVTHGLVEDAPRVAAEAFQILGEISLDDPNPPELIRIWLYTHPPIAERVLFAQEYDPWSKGEPPRFVR